MTEIITRKEAAAHGLKRYFLGIPCLDGHIAERYTKGAHCVECALENRKKWAEEVPGRNMVWAKNNKEKTLEINRQFYARIRRMILPKSLRHKKANVLTVESR